MAEETNLSFTLGNHWPIDFALNDADGEDLDLSNGTVKFRMKRRGVLAMELTTAGADIEVDSPSNGNGTITVEPADQADLYPAVYDYEVLAILEDETVTTQAFGAITVAKSLFA